jgi:hypothetical protein
VSELEHLARVLGVNTAKGFHKATWINKS